MPGWSIREAQKFDLDHLVEFRLELQDHLERTNPDIWRFSADGREHVRDQLAELMSDQDARVLVALDDNEIPVGMATGRVHTSENHIPSSTGSVGLLFVSEPWRRRGIGAGLVKRLCRFFHSRGLEDIWVRYVAENSEATRFWTKLGFRPRIISAGTKLNDLDREISTKEAAHER